MRYTILVLAVVIAAGAADARAEMVSYNMTGTITSVTATWGYNGLDKPRTPTPLPFAVGDHISGTLQYDSSTAGSIKAYSWGSNGDYNTSAPVITNVVDQTTGFQFPPHPITTTPGLFASVGLENPIPSGAFRGGEIVAQDQSSDASSRVNDSLLLSTSSPLPTLNLAEFQLTKLPVILDNVNYSYLTYYSYSYTLGEGYQIEAAVDSIPGVTAAAPEPGSLTLFLLGAAGLAAGGIRRRLGILQT
ncbi:MAG: PEP-CTERM sorting domain-containing protein [Gemmataceae bacterium]